MLRSLLGIKKSIRKPEKGVNVLCHDGLSYRRVAALRTKGLESVRRCVTLRARLLSDRTVSSGTRRGTVVMVFLLLTASAYFVGSINFAIVVMKATGREDPRSKFSGNAGATNVYRQAGMFWAAVVLMLDFGRALLLSFVSIQLSGTSLTPWIGLFLLLGNRFPCFHQFKGGKGVGSYIGFTAALSPLASAISCLVWVAAYSIFRVPFIASLGMILVLVTGCLISVSWNTLAIIGIGLSATLLFANHWSNIKIYYGSK
jgi:glycerol-3-phosphate acyltransferase PlsY